MTPGNELLFLALGGSGEIGMNVNLYGADGKWIMVDCGMTFGDPYYPGIELVLPDLEFIEDRADDLLGIVLTHGHEDHIGALPYLAGDLGVPLYATAFTAGLIRRKLEEAGLIDEIELNIIEPETDFSLGPFGLRYIPLAHSILEGNALVIDTDHGRIFHTGDWKLDPDPQTGTPTTGEELTAIGDTGILALVCDSTNVFNEKDSGSEGAVKSALADIIAAATGRVLVTTFASNAARLQTLGRIANETGRKVCVAGRSLDRIIDTAQSVGYLTDFPPTIDFEEAMRVPARELLIVATGGQGESRAALSRIAEDNHPITLDSGDLVIFSSKQIPGNELAIGRVQNALAEKQIPMITDRQAFVHVSGHPGRPELAKMYQWIRPEILVPVHGEIRHMAEQARFASDHGIAKTIVQKNGDVVRLAPDGPQIISHERAGRLVLDGDTIVTADGEAMNERRRIGGRGLIAVTVAYGADGKMRGIPAFSMAGIPVEEDREAFIDDAVEAAADAARSRGKDLEQLREAIRLAVRRTATDWTGKRPVVNVSLMEV